MFHPPDGERIERKESLNDSIKFVRQSVQLQMQGHGVRLMSPEYVRPYVKVRDEDDRDAEAFARGRDLTAWLRLVLNL